MDLSQQQIDKAAHILAGAGGVLAAYVTGSVATGRQTPLSDLDLAVWLDPTLQREQRWEMRLNLLLELTLGLRTDAIDLAVLNDVGPIKRYALLKNGKRLFCKDAAAVIDLQVWTMKEYFDFLPIYRQHEAALRERIRTGRFGHGG